MKRLRNLPGSTAILLVWFAASIAAGCAPAAPGLAAATAPERTETLPPTPGPTATAEPTRTAAPTAAPTETPVPTPTPVILAGAGDIAVCGLEGAGQTAELLAGIDGEIFTAGDNVNDSGRRVEYQNCFGPTWGQFLDRIHPAPGNHDYMTEGGLPYYEYFGAAAGEPGKGWYSYDLGAWHIVALNTNCDDVSCKEDSPQVNWLREDLAKNDARCTLAHYHHPRWSSGLAGSSGWISPIYRALYENGVDVVVNGHDHDYERIAPLDPEGNPDPERGIRTFVAGTGGASLRAFGEPIPGSEARIANTHGVLQFTLYEDRYDWAFLPVGGGEPLDSGSEMCR